MNTIDTIEDLIELLDRNPRWMDALRSRILTQELLELPARFAELVERLDRFGEEVGKFREEIDRLREEIDRLREEVSGFIAATNRRLGRLEATTDRLEAKTDRILVDLGSLKAAHARNGAVREASTIARELGLRRTRTLTHDDLWDLTDRVDTTAIDSSDLRSFRLADLIMEATDASGAPCYVAVEISYTANGRDTRRARRNAEFLTRFTGKGAYAVVSGVRQDDRIRDSIKSGEVVWFQLDPEIMEVD